MKAAIAAPLVAMVWLFAITYLILNFINPNLTEKETRKVAWEMPRLTSHP